EDGIRDRNVTGVQTCALPIFANHIGVYGVIQVLRALESGRYTIEEIDAITGPALGRPKSATFRTADIVGIDVLAHVAKNLNLPRSEERRVGKECSTEMERAMY